MSECVLLLLLLSVASGISSSTQSAVALKEGEVVVAFHHCFNRFTRLQSLALALLTSRLLALHATLRALCPRTSQPFCLVTGKGRRITWRLRERRNLD